MFLRRVMPGNGQEDRTPMAPPAAFLSDLNVSTALAIAIVTVTVTTSVVVIGWLFTRLAPARRRDLVELVRAIRRGGSDNTT